MTASEMTSTSPSSSRSGPRRYIIFDGSMDFQLWRARVENELLRFHLLGYIYVKDYDGSQAFTYNSEEIPPKCGMVAVPATATPVTVSVSDEQQQQVVANASDANSNNVVIKDEPTHAVVTVDGKKPTARTGMVLQQGRLSRLEVIAERAEAMSILQRYLHPEVERAILGKNIYDSWATLCGMYGNRNVSDFYTVHRLLHAMQLGEKAGESARDFIARLELAIEQYAQIAGIQVTDQFRSMVLASALPKAWMPLLDAWKAFKPYIPYAQLVEKVTFEFSSRQVLQERDAALAAETSDSKTPLTLRVATDTKPSAAPAPSPASSQRSKASPVPPKASSSSQTKASPSSSTSDKSKTAHARSDEKHSAKSESSKAKGSSDEKRSERSSHSSKHDDYKRDDRDYDRKRDDYKRDDYKRDDKRDDYKRSDKHYDSRRSDDRDYDSRRSDDRDYDRKRDDAKRDDWRDSSRDYGSSSLYDKTVGSVSNAGFQKQVCFYCLKQGHRFYTCWFLRVDIENGTWVNPHKKFSATVTSERTPSMVQRLEQYVHEVRMRDQPVAGAVKPYEDPYDVQAKTFLAENAFGPPSGAGAYRYDAPQQQQALELPQTPSRTYSELASMRSQSMFHDNAAMQQQRPPTYMHASSGYAPAVAPAAPAAEPDAERYKKRPRSDFGGDAEQVDATLSRDPRTRTSGFHQPPSTTGTAS